MNATDYYIEAVRTWQQRRSDDWHFAECCAMVDGARTAALSADCNGLSVDTIEAYRKAYRLYYRWCELSDTSRMREKGNISLWIAAARYVERIPDATLYDYLKTAINNGTAVRAFGIVLSQYNQTQPDWTRRILRFAGMAAKLRTDYKTEMPISFRQRFETLIAEFENKLKKLVEEISESETA